MRSAYTCAPVKNTTAWALLWAGEHAGRIVASCSRTGCRTATMTIWAGPWKIDSTLDRDDAISVHGHAGGHGYDRLSGAIADAANHLPTTHPAHDIIGRMHGSGSRSIVDAFTAAGYTVIEVL